MFSRSVNIVDRSPPRFETVGTQRARYCSGCLNVETAGNNMMICSRCKVVPYCGPDCQKDHFESHKKDCKMMGHILKSAAADPLQHAKKLFAVSYRSCNDYRHVHWEPCIDAYNLALSKGVRGYQIHDEMALVWLGLDKLTTALEELVKNVEFGPYPAPGIKVKGLTVLDDANDVPKAWNTEWTETDLLILLAIKLQVIAQLRGGESKYGRDVQDATATKDDGTQVILKDQERQARVIIKRLGDWWGGRLAYALRDARPFTKTDAKGVIFTEPEHFNLLQDTFFKTPGVKDVLYEFVV